MTTANDILNVARKYLGVDESTSAFKYIIDTYNRTTPLPAGYRMQYNDNWCATFVSFCAIEAGVPNLYGRECGVERFIKVFQNLGIWIEDGTIRPQVGDIICYNWDQGYQPNNGFADHIGFVEAVNGNQITCLEGNKHEKVDRRYINVGWGYIRGYARPKYSGTSKPTAKNGWKKEGNYWFYYANNKRFNSGASKDNWKEIGKKWYLFDKNGAMYAKVWKKIGTSWFYLTESGATATGWQNINNRYYHFSDSGYMKEGWLQEGKTWYYMKSGGEMATGWFKDKGGNWYYLSKPGGQMVTGKVPIDGKTYNFDKNGKCLNP